MTILKRLLLAAACSLLVPAAVPLAASAQTRVVPANRPDQHPRTTMGRQPAGPGMARSQARAAPIGPFVLNQVVIENSTLPPAALEVAWRPFVGKTLDNQGLLQVTEALASVYERNDVAIYTVTVPVQTFEGGVLRVRALEGHVDETVLAGPEGARNRELIERYLAHITAERPLRRSTLQRYVSLIRDIPGLQVEMDLENGSGEQGVRLKLGFKPQPVQVGLSINNRGTAYLGRTQVQGDLYLNSLLRQGDQTRFTAAVPTDLERFRAFGVQHSQPVGSDGLTVAASFNYLRTRPKGTEILGHATSAGVQATYPLLRSYARDAYLVVSLDGVDADNAFLGFRFADDRTRALRAALSYSAQTERRLVYVSGTLSQGIDGLGARGNTAVGELDFRKLNARGGANFALGETAALRLAGSGQWTGDRLPGAEQFSLGGEEFGRGYEASVIAGDYGYAASAELAYSPAKLPATFRGSEAYAFVDGGKVWYRGRFGAPTDSANLKSAGAGVRVAIANRVVVQLEASRALENRIAFLDRDWRGVFLVRTIF